jgi:hypothetical protein
MESPEDLALSAQATEVQVSLKHSHKKHGGLVCDHSLDRTEETSRTQKKRQSGGCSE